MSRLLTAEACGPSVVKVLRCPGCGGDVESTGSGPAWMNSFQWDASKAGDYYCTSGCTAGTNAAGHRYFSRRAVTDASFCDSSANPVKGWASEVTQ